MNTAPDGMFLKVKKAGLAFFLRLDEVGLPDKHLFFNRFQTDTGKNEENR